MAKLKLTTDTEGLSVTSFKRKVPKIFSKTLAFKVIRRDASYFDTIPSYTDWNTTDDGFHDTLLYEFKSFQHYHNQLLRESLGDGTTTYTVAHSSLTNSVSWMEESIRFMDDTYNEYVDSKFNAKKAWNITTRLARTLLIAIYEPRSGLSKAFRTRKPRQIKETIFRSTLKSLDIMTSLSKSGFLNSPIVANELIKFLAINTQVEAIERLTKELADLKRDNEKMRRDLKEALDKVTECAKISNGANNKSDQAKSNYEGLAKRVKKNSKKNDFSK